MASIAPTRERLRSLWRSGGSGGMLRGLALVLLPLLVQGILLAVLIVDEPSRDRAEQQALRAREEAYRVEAAARALLLWKDRLTDSMLGHGFLPPETAVTADPLADLTALRGELRDDPAQASLAAELAASARALRAWIVEAAALVKEGRREEAARLAATEGAGLQGDFLAKLGQLEAAAQRRGQAAEARLAAVRRSRRTLLLGSLFAVLGIGLLVAWLFYRQVSARLAVITANARRMAESSPLSPPLGGTDQISRLDLTLRQTADRLTETIRQHEAALEVTAEELAAANRELRLKTEELEAFIRGVSHDLRSPLVNIKGFSREIELSYQDLQRLLAAATVPAEMRGRLEEIDREARESVYYLGTAVASADRIITALQRLARAGHRHYEWQTLDIREIVTRLADAMHAMVTEKSAEVVIGELPPAWGDATAVEQIFSNLLKNAVSYLDPARPGRVEIDALPSLPGAPITYRVRDNGVGIPAERQPAIFTAFQRIRGELAEGEGIGLALVQRAVTRLGGEIRLESEEGVGSTFFVTLRTDYDRKATPLPFPARLRPPT